MGKIDKFKKICPTPADKLGIVIDPTPADKLRPLNRGMLEAQNTPLSRIQLKGIEKQKQGMLESQNIPLSRGQDEVLGVAKTEVLASFKRISYNPKLKSRSKKMSREMTAAECNIWFNILSKKQLLGYKFTKQKIVFNYILDFYCSELLLAIEIDGESHNTKQDYDLARTKFLNSINIKVVRFTNSEAMNNLEGIKNYLENYIKLNYNL